jgi:hypothetical protein
MRTTICGQRRTVCRDGGQLVRDLPRVRVREMRGSLRARVAASPLMDGARFARHVEAVYCDVWLAWCGQVRSVAQDKHDSSSGAEPSPEPRSNLRSAALTLRS